MVVHKEFVLEGVIVNSQYYNSVLDKLKLIGRVRPAQFFFCTCDFFILHDNAPANIAAINQ